VDEENDDDEKDDENARRNTVHWEIETHMQFPNLVKREATWSKISKKFSEKEKKIPTRKLSHIRLLLSQIVIGP
jgi:hypothetical protein